MPLLAYSPSPVKRSYRNVGLWANERQKPPSGKRTSRDLTLINARESESGQSLCR